MRWGYRNENMRREYRIVDVKLCWMISLPADMDTVTLERTLRGHSFAPVPV